MLGRVGAVDRIEYKVGMFVTWNDEYKWECACKPNKLPNKNQGHGFVRCSYTREVHDLPHVSIFVLFVKAPKYLITKFVVIGSEMIAYISVCICLS